jgi:hypothetical protein
MPVPTRRRLFGFRSGAGRQIDRLKPVLDAPIGPNDVAVRIHENDNPSTLLRAPDIAGASWLRGTRGSWLRFLRERSQSNSRSWSLSRKTEPSPTVKAQVPFRRCLCSTERWVARIAGRCCTREESRMTAGFQLGKLRRSARSNARDSLALRL